MPEHTPGYTAALAAAEHHSYIQTLVAQLEHASEFRIPCPGHPHGHHADLHVVRRHDGQADGWAILRDGPFGDAWTGTAWKTRSSLHRHDIYHYSRDDALTEAARIAPLQTTAYQTYIASLRAEVQEEPTQ